MVECGGNGIGVFEGSGRDQGEGAPRFSEIW